MKVVRYRTSSAENEDGLHATESEYREERRRQKRLVSTGRQRLIHTYRRYLTCDEKEAKYSVSGQTGTKVSKYALGRLRSSIEVY